MKERLAEIKARCEKATGGPWEWDSELEDNCWLCAGDYIVADCHNYDDLPVGKDRDFIANAREDIPWLISLVESLLEAFQSSEEVGHIRRTLAKEYPDVPKV